MALVTNNGSILPLAGVSTTSTGKFAPTNDGTTALIQAVTLTDQTGAAVTIGSGQTVQGMAADGAAVTGNPVLTAGFDGTNTQTILTDTSGRVISVGAAASGVATAGNPILQGGRASTTVPSAVTTGQAANLWLGTNGQVMVGYGIGSSGFTAFSGVQLASDTGGTARPLGVVPCGYNGSTSDAFKTAVGAALVNTGAGVQAVEEAGRTFSNITSATTTTAKSGAGHFHTLTINTYVASATITIYDNTAGSGTKIATITLPSTITSDVPTTLTYDLAFSTGLTFVTSGATDITVTYR